MMNFLTLKERIVKVNFYYDQILLNLDRDQAGEKAKRD